ncbi:unnamed protein product [Linum tenue]|uniref:Uncharacterized protein n=1 Tax=Linum tenue TaxID=586396 RepID=A0AAV0JSD8_9ROSI|nr:unnamed protein product [Linum tenue]
MEIIILLGFHLLFYTTLLILQRLFSSAALLLLPISIAALFTLHPNHDGGSSLPIALLRKLMRSRDRLGEVVAYAIDSMHEKLDVDEHHHDALSPKIVALWTSFAAYMGLMAQILFRYPFSGDTFFAGGMIAIAIVANLVAYFSFAWDSASRKKLREERERWEEEKRNLKEELVRAKRGSADQQPQKLSADPPAPRPLGRASSGPITSGSYYSMYGNFDWD